MPFIPVRFLTTQVAAAFAEPPATDCAGAGRRFQCLPIAAGPSTDGPPRTVVGPAERSVHLPSRRRRRELKAAAPQESCPKKAKPPKRRGRGESISKTRGYVLLARTVGAPQVDEATRRVRAARRRYEGAALFLLKRRASLAALDTEPPFRDLNMARNAAARRAARALNRPALAAVSEATLALLAASRNTLAALHLAVDGLDASGLVAALVEIGALDRARLLPPAMCARSAIASPPRVRFAALRALRLTGAQKEIAKTPRDEGLDALAACCPRLEALELRELDAATYGGWVTQHDVGAVARGVGRALTRCLPRLAHLRVLWTDNVWYPRPRRNLSRSVASDYPRRGRGVAATRLLWNSHVTSLAGTAVRMRRRNSGISAVLVWSAARLWGRQRSVGSWT